MTFVAIAQDVFLRCTVRLYADVPPGGSWPLTEMLHHL
jgi:hypothetical protein